MHKRFLEQCENEALQRSGAIQAHGCLLVADSEGFIRHVSDNTGEFLGHPPSTYLDQVLPAALAIAFGSLAMTPGTRQVHEQLLEGVHGLLDLVISRGSHGEAVLEFTPCLAPPGWQLPPSKPLPPPPSDATGLQLDRQQLVEQIADLTGFERVMYYIFREDGDGEVIAEARRGEAYGAYLGLRFPASDIPRIARALYVKNPWRLIPDATSAAVAIRGQGEPPDLTYSDLRSVSPVHQVYLANMGVAASLSFPVVAAGNLIALIAAHHSLPQKLPVQVMEAAASEVKAHTFALLAYQSQQRMRLIDGMEYRFQSVKCLLQRHGDLFSGWPELAAWLLPEFQADGAILCQNDEFMAIGSSFEAEVLEVFDTWFCDNQGEFVWSTDSLGRQIGAFPLSEIAGVLAIRIGGGRNRQGRPGTRIYLTRNEHVHEVHWGGNPDKPVEYHDGQIGIAPRRSFEKWVERRLGSCRAWNNESRLLALKLRELITQGQSL